jgi:hypothetical protein
MPDGSAMQDPSGMTQEQLQQLLQQYQGQQ